MVGGRADRSGGRSGGQTGGPGGVLSGGRTGWRGSLAAAAVLGGATLLLAYQGTRLPAPPRYVLHMAGPIAMMVPVGLIRLARTALPRLWGPWAAAAVAVGGVVYLVAVGNPAQVYRTIQQLDVEQQLLRDGIDEVRERLAPGDSLMDCTELRIPVALLPRQVLPPPPMVRHVDPERCAAWMESPEPDDGERWLLTLDQTVDGTGWEPVARRERASRVLTLWRWTAGDHSNSTKIGTDVSSR